jgi:hypothetical protein
MNMTNTAPTVENNAYKSLLYWRRNLWNGSACVPVILTLEAGTLTMKNAEGTVIFSEPQEGVVPRFTGWGTMVLTIQGKKYDFVGMPAADSPAVSDLQKAELSAVKVGDTNKGLDVQPVVVSSAAASAVGGGAAVVGAAASTATYYRGLSSIREWKSLIGSQADQKKSMNFMTYFIGLVIIGLIIAIAFK